MGYNVTFSRERYADLIPIIEKAIALEAGKSFSVSCPDKSPHTVAQKIREYFRLGHEFRPDAIPDPKPVSVAVFAESRKIVITKPKPVEYGAFIIEE